MIRRFSNPFSHHKLEAIALNSVAKWKDRILPILLERKELPFYLARSAGELYRMLLRNHAATDAPETAARFSGNYTLDDFLADQALWGMDLRTIPGLREAASREDW